MDLAAGPPRKIQKENDYLQDFLRDVELDDKFAEQLTKFRVGPPAVRKQLQKDLSETKQPVKLVQSLVPLAKQVDLNAAERVRLIKLLIRMLQNQPSLGSNSPLVSVVDNLLDLIIYLLNMKDNNVHKDEAQPLLLSVARVLGMKTFVTALRPHFETTDDNIRHSCATCIAGAAQTFGLSLTIPLIKVLVNSAVYNEQVLGILVIQRLPKYLGSGTLPFLRDLAVCCAEALKDANLSNAATSAISILAETVAPFGIEAFEPHLTTLWNGARRRRGRPKLLFLRALAALVPLTYPDARAELANPILSMVMQILTDKLTPEASESEEGGQPLLNSFMDADQQRLALRVARKITCYVSSEELDKFLPLLFSTFWVPDMATDRRTASLAVWTAAELPVSRSALVQQLVDAGALTSTSIYMQTMALELLARADVVPLVLSHRTEERLLDGLLAALPTANTLPQTDQGDEGLVDLAVVMENSKIDKDAAAKLTPSYLLSMSEHAVQKLFEALSPDRRHVYSRTWITALLERDSSPSPLIRQNAVRIIAALSPYLQDSELRIILKKLYEELGEEYPEVLGDVINAVHAVLTELTERELEIDPPLSQILPRLSPILRNRNERVQEYCTKLIRSVSALAGETISAREWIQICFELLELQRSQRQKVRYEATAAFAAIAQVVGPAGVVAALLNHLRSPDRQFRVTTAAAIASIGSETEPFTILPVLMNEYSTCETVIQHGVLKTLSFLFQFVERGKASPYLDSTATLVDDALLDRNQVHRQTAASIVHYMAKGSVGLGKEELFVHFLNELMPSIFETSPHVIDRVLEAVDSVRQVIGTPAFVNYLWAGLFHPARKVRNVYWQMWNSAYKEDADAIVPANPVMVPDLINSKTDIRDVWF